MKPSFSGKRRIFNKELAFIELLLCSLVKEILFAFTHPIMATDI